LRCKLIDKNRNGDRFNFVKDFSKKNFFLNNVKPGEPIADQAKMCLLMVNRWKVILLKNKFYRSQIFDMPGCPVINQNTVNLLHIIQT
jgi:hypothetical protein